MNAAFAPHAAIKPGDTIWLRGGTYRGSFTSRLVGSGADPIIVRQYPGERATLDGAHAGGTSVLAVGGAHTWYWGFEIMNSDPNRVSSQITSFPTDIARGTGYSNTSNDGIKLINLVIHDTAAGVNSFSLSTNAEVYGTLIYNNGWIAPNQGNGPGIYTQNTAPSSKRYIDNVIFGNFGLGIEAYGSPVAAVDNLHFEGNAIFKSGGANPRQDFLVGGEAGANGATIINNFIYENRNGASSAFNLGFLGSSGTTNAVVQNNYFACKSYFVSPQNLNMSGNTFTDTITSLNQASYPSNTYLNENRPSSGAVVSVRPNQYERGRANVVIYNWGQAPTVNVDLSNVLSPGATYEIRNAQNFYGQPILTGTYSGGSIAFPTYGFSPAVPVGLAPRPATGPEFNVYVVLPTSRSTAVPDRARPRPAQQ